MSEINVTPLVDVMLVLLIVFMVSAPLSTVGVPIDLPTTQADIMEPPPKPTMISITLDGSIFIGEDAILEQDVLTTVNSLAQKGTDERLYIRGDTQVQHGQIMKVMGTLSDAEICPHWPDHATRTGKVNMQFAVVGSVVFLRFRSRGDCAVCGYAKTSRHNHERVYCRQPGEHAIHLEQYDTHNYKQRDPRQGASRCECY